MKMRGFGDIIGYQQSGEKFLKLQTQLYIKIYLFMLRVI